MLKLPREPNTAGDVCPLRLSVSFQAPDTRPAATDIGAMRTYILLRYPPSIAFA